MTSIRKSSRCGGGADAKTGWGHPAGIIFSVIFDTLLFNF
jgi:hypothetical protein